MKRILSVFLLMGVVGFGCIVEVANAQCTTSWISASGGSWNDASNWSNGVPGSSSNACIKLGGNYTVTLNGAVSIKSLTLGTTANTTTQTLEVKNSLNLSDSSRVLPSGAIIWTAGTIDGSGNLMNKGTITLNSTPYKQITTNFINDGIVKVRASITIRTDSLINEPDGTITVAGNLSISGAYGGWIINRGNFKKTGGDGLAAITCGFMNEGSVQVGSGNLRLAGPANLHGGSYNAAQGDSLQFASGNIYANGQLTGNPSGAVVLMNGVMSADTGEATLDFGGSGFQWFQGTLQSRAVGMWVNNGSLHIISDKSKSLNNANIENHSSIDITGGLTIRTDSLINESDGTITVAGNLSISGEYGGWVVNRGSFKKTGGNGLASIKCGFMNEGSVQVGSGNLRLAGPANLHGGTYDVAQGDSLQFASGSVYANGQLTGNPSGAVVLMGGTMSADAGEATLDFGGTGFQWFQGALQRRAGGVWINNGSLHIISGKSKELNNANIENHSSIDITGGLMIRTDSLINESDGTITVTGDLTVSGAYGGWIINRGSFVKTGKGKTTITPSFINAASGTIAGTGTLQINNLRKNFGMIAHGSSSGLFTWNGALPMDSSTAGLETNIGGSNAGTDYGQLITTGKVTLNGKLSVHLINGYVPQNGDIYTLLKAPNVIGLFDTLSGLTANNVSLYPTVSATGIQLKAHSGVPTLTNSLTVTPTDTTNGAVVTFVLSGTGFAPDDNINLVCTGCTSPKLFPVIPGRIEQMTPTSVHVQFDLSNPFISGKYNLLMKDPRGGSEAVPIIIGTESANNAVDIIAQDPDASEKGPKPGVVTVKLSAPSATPTTIKYELGGTAQEFVDYFPSAYSPSALGSVTIPAGQMSASIVITPIPDFVADPGETVTVKLVSSSNYPIISPDEATVTIADGPPPTKFAVLSASPDLAGNDGTITMMVDGQDMTQGATARLVGNTTLTPSIVSVDSSGNLMQLLFNTTGIAPGSKFDLVVTNGDGETATIHNAMTIEKLVKPEVAVHIIGPHSFRSYLPPQTYYVTLTNRGNVDAVAVPLSIAVWEANAFGELIPKFKIANFDPTKIKGAPPNFPGWGNRRALERRGNRWVLSVIVPLLRAGETKTFAFLGRSHHIKAWTSPTSKPLAGPMLAEASSHAKISGQGNTVASMWMGENPYHVAYSAWQMLKCAGTVASIGLGFHQAAGCAVKVTAYATRALSALYGLGVSKPNAAHTALTSFSFNGGWLATALNCASAIAGENPYGAALRIVSGIVGGASVANACWPWQEPHGTGIYVDEIKPRDPNNKVGPTGNGDMHYTAGVDAAGYMIHFENDTSATAPALFVHVTDPLDVSKFDLSTFSLGSIAFGDTSVTPPPNLKQWTTTVKLPNENRFVVRITAGLDEKTGIASWQLMAIDPKTGQYPTDQKLGFLPPDVNPPEGEGSVFFTIHPKSGLPSGTVLSNKASIVFDANDPIETPTWVNKLDYDLPTSTMEPLSKTQSDTSFTVSWKGSDPTSGVSDYLIYVSTNGGTFSLWADTSATSAVFHGEPDSTYAFYSVARDMAGNIQNTPDSAETSTTDVATSIDTNIPTGLPKKYALDQNYPNPFNPTTTIRFALPKSGYTRLRVYNILGQLVATLVDENMKAGYYTIRVDARRWSSGLYFYTIHSGKYTQVKKMLFIK